MSTLRLKYVQSFTSAEGVYHYFRRRGQARVRLPGIVGSPEFMQVYADALAAAPVAIGKSLRSRPGSISAAIAEYFTSRAFKNFTGGTPAQRKTVLEAFRAKYGDRTLASLPTSFLIALFDSMAPHSARLGIRLKVPKSDGFATWTEDEIAAFEACHAVGTRARLAFALGLFTAQRRGDVVRIGRQHIRDGVLAVRQAKTGASLSIPVHPELKEIIAATPIGHLTLLTTQTGKSYHPNDFTEQFRRWCDAADLPPRCVFHGLRKAACRRLAEAGCSVHEIAAISGHKTLKEVERYTKAADQARLARAGMERIGIGSVKAEPVGVSKPLSQLSKKAG